MKANAGCDLLTDAWNLNNARGERNNTSHYGCTNAGLETAATEVPRSEIDLTCLTCFILTAQGKRFWWVLKLTSMQCKAFYRSTITFLSTDYVLLTGNLRNIFSGEIRSCRLYTGCGLSEQECFILRRYLALRTMCWLWTIVRKIR